MKTSNGLFAQAVNWILENEDIKDQQELAEFTGITETTLSRILNDKVKKPSKATIRKLMDKFPGLFNPAYFRGESVYLLMADSIDAKMEAEQKNEESNTVDLSSAINSALSANMAYIEELKEQIQKKDEETKARIEDKDAQIADLKELIKEKDDHIATLKKQVALLTSQIRQQEKSDYPFPISTAEPKKKVAK